MRKLMHKCMSSFATETIFFEEKKINTLARAPNFVVLDTTPISDSMPRKAKSLHPSNSIQPPTEKKQNQIKNF